VAITEGSKFILERRELNLTNAVAHLNVSYAVIFDVRHKTFYNGSGCEFNLRSANAAG
jgi:hypothetical protein